MENIKLRLYGIRANRRQMLIIESIFFLVFSLLAIYFFFFCFQNESMERQKQLLDEEFENWKGSLDQVDDVCLLGLRI